ncbi:hypothetical protein ACL9RF_04285 [Sphingobacterium sp. Mn56C]|uniref:hypothetical protein n=1 Tax=Sphingobacterium sp. Mn56C TaxID=3395261 RepID=UPI003BBA7983
MKNSKNMETAKAKQKTYQSPVIAITRIGLEGGFAIESAPLNPTSEFEEIVTEWEQGEDVSTTIEW